MENTPDIDKEFKETLAFISGEMNKELVRGIIVGAILSVGGMLIANSAKTYLQKRRERKLSLLELAALKSRED
ncbi:MAG: hypothetical protein ABWY25_03635 [Paenisporosarcina sp.]